MRKVLSALAITAAAIASTVVNPGPAVALGNEQLGCYVLPASGSQPPQPSPGFCWNNSMPAGSYSANFRVMNLNGSYSYAWSVPALYASKVTSGCTSTSSYCVIGNLTPTRAVTVSVTISQSGQSSSLEATAYIEQWCGNSYCG